MSLRRHAYRKDGDAVCKCGQGRSEDVHNMLAWRKAPSGSWVSDLTKGVVYRIRTRRLSGINAVWWPEYGVLDELRRAEKENEGWTRIGNGVGVSLAQAKMMCEEQREAEEDSHAQAQA